MYIVIIGAGRIGTSLAKWLVGAKHEVAVIDQDPSRGAVLEDQLGSVSVVGDGTDAGVLAKAGVNRADVFIAVTGRDDDNMVACQLARHRFGASYTVALINNGQYEALFNLLGIDLTINVTDMIVERVEEGLSGRLMEEVSGLG